MSKPRPRANADTAPFWQACNEERLLFQRCCSCEGAQFYPRSLCARCQSKKLEWEEASPYGVVYSYTVVERAPRPVFAAEAPYVIALIDIDAGFRMLTNVVGCAPVAVAIGMAVRIVFEDRDGQKVPQAMPLDDAVAQASTDP